MAQKDMVDKYALVDQYSNHFFVDLCLTVVDFSYSKLHLLSNVVDSLYDVY